VDCSGFEIREARSSEIMVELWFECNGRIYTVEIRADRTMKFQIRVAEESI
jgi:hypothetical protein